MEQDVIFATYERYNAEDLEAVLALCCEDVNWANALTGDRIRGRAQMREHWALQMTSLRCENDSDTGV